MDDRTNAETMNDYFVNITQHLDIPEFYKEHTHVDITYVDPIDETVHNFSNHPSITKIYTINKNTGKFSFNTIDQKQMEKEVLQLKPKKSAGPDDIPPKIVKDSSTVLKATLTELFNTSVNENFFPSDLKYANVSPLFKKGDSTNKENYRRISILPSISKFFERLMQKQMNIYLEKYLSQFLCGYSK